MAVSCKLIHLRRRRSAAPTVFPDYVAASRGSTETTRQPEAPFQSGDLPGGVRLIFRALAQALVTGFVEPVVRDGRGGDKRRYRSHAAQAKAESISFSSGFLNHGLSPALLIYSNASGRLERSDARTIGNPGMDHKREKLRSGVRKSQLESAKFSNIQCRSFLTPLSSALSSLQTR